MWFAAKFETSCADEPNLTVSMRNQSGKARKMRRYEHDFFKTRKLRICDIAEKIMRKFVKMSPHYTRLCSHVCAFCAKCAVEKSSVCAMTAHLKNRISMRLRAVSLNWRFEVQLKQPKSIRGAVTSAFSDVVSIADSAVFRLAQATFPASGKALTDRCGVQVSDSSPDCLKLLYVNVSHHAASKCFAFRRSVCY